MKKEAILIAAIGMLSLAVYSSSHALTLADVGAVDTLIVYANVNSGDGSELDWVNHVLFGNDSKLYYTTMKKVDTADLPADPAPWQSVDDGQPDTRLYAYDFQTYAPEYFFIKVGQEGNSIKSDDPGIFYDHFLYKNIGNLNWGVVELNLSAGMVDISGVGKISHTAEFGGSPVPEPATVLLFGSGLMGLAGILRKRRKHSRLLE
jgi:hypothetical protein